jgi:outer membrane protein OmpA-like peptidoglycan-associated protein
MRNLNAGGVVLCVLATAALAVGEIQGIGGRVLDLKTRSLELILRVEDIGAKGQSLTLKEDKTEIRIELAGDVLFDFDKAAIRPEAQETLKQVAAVIVEKAKGKVRIEGYTDSKGSDAYNQRLSEQRAKAVGNWLVEKEGLKQVKFVTRGFGEAKPVVPNTKLDGSDDPEGRQKNRRVEIIVSK